MPESQTDANPADALSEVREALDADFEDLLEPDVFGDELDASGDDGDGLDHDHDHDHDHDGADGGDEDEDEEEEEEAEAAAPRKRRFGVLPAVAVLGGGAWVVSMAMRCGAPPTDELSVPPGVEDVEDVDAAPDPAKPEPALGDEEPGQPMDDQPGEPDRGEPDEELEDAEPDPPPQDWAKDITPPDVVTYTIRHGGAIKNVANLYKIFHHEITALNPGIGLDDELPPGSSVVVYRRQPDEVSQSVGIASNGSLEGGVPMLDGPGRVLKMIPWKSWATANTVATLDRVLRQWAADETNEQPILVGNMSSRHGGRLEPHSTHQSGRDVDLGYPQILPAGEELNWREMNADNLDAAATWRLLKLVRATGQLEVVFIDSKIQKLLYEWARKEGGMSKSSLRRWMEYPRSPGVSSALIQHVPGHVDHLHVRLECGAHEKRCKSRKR